MGIEFVLLLIIGVLGIAGFLLFSGSFGIAKAADDGSTEKERPTHAYVEDRTRGRIFGAKGRDRARRAAEEDPETEIRH